MFPDPPGRGLLSAGLFSNLFAVLLCLVLHLMFDCVRKVVDSLVCRKQSKQMSLSLAASKISR